MHKAIRYWPYAMLAARWKYDYNPLNDKPTDYVETVIKRWHPETLDFREYRPGGIAYSYVLELPSEIIISNLGTINSRDMSKNFTGAITGFFKNSFTLSKNKTECHDDYWQQGKETWSVLKRFWLRKKPVVIVGHSKGCGRSVAMSRLAVEASCARPLTIQYNPPPAFTKKGVLIYDKLGLQECTYCVKAKDDIVSKASMFGYYKHVGIPIELPDVVGAMADIPLVGEHAYSTTTEALKKWATRMGDDEGREYLESREYVEVC